ncbi:MAG: hypothetical protein ACRC28_18615 [Clostridium sp.]|uniref:hypothetical protein n=1 Tax=Clostridium sp. TaxID=1506 RepID=UPI003F2E8747
MKNKIDRVMIYNMGNAIRAAKYAMATDTNKVQNNITKMTLILGNAKPSSGHNNFLKGILVSFDITLSNKLWVEWERYIFAPIITSQSTMHKICSLNLDESLNGRVYSSTIEQLKLDIERYNNLEDRNTTEAKELYQDILYNVPSGIELTAHVTTNYMALANIYRQRKGHRLDEWKPILKTFEQFPYFKELCLQDENREEVIGNYPANCYTGVYTEKGLKFI